MTSSGPMVQDFTSRDRALSLHIEAAPAFEFLLSLFVYHGEHDDNGDDIYVAGSTLFEQVQEHASADLRAALDDLNDCGCAEVWLGMIGHVFDSPDARDVDGLIESVRSMDPADLRRYSLKGSGFKPAHGHAAELVERAAAGDAEAVAELLADRKPDSSLRRLMEMAPVDTRDHLVWVLEHFREEVWPHLDDATAVLERDAAEKEALAQTMSPERLVETATNGVTFERQGWMTGVVLIPSAVIRPWVLITNHETLQIFCYAVSEEHLAADPEAPPGYLVDMFKALADENRLRILKIIDSGENRLSKIAEHLDVAKSTAHHHLRVLRTAGLVRTVLTDGGSRYELRREAIPETGLLLNAFLPGSSQSTQPQ